MKRRAGILGHGYMGRVRRAALERRAGCEVARVFDGEGDGWRDVVDDPRVDCVFVCLPSHLTCEAVCRSLEADKDVLAEKPPGLSVSEVRQMMAAEAASGRRLKFGFNHRYHPAFLAAKARLRAGDLGSLVWLRGLYGKPMAPGFAESWRARRALAGGGIFLDQGIHMLDLMRDLAGGFDAARAFASSSASREVEDDLVAILRSDAGQVATLCSSHTQARAIFSLELGLTGGAITMRGLLSKSGRYGPEQLAWRAREATGEHVSTFETDRSWDLELDELFGDEPIRVGSSAEALEVMILVEAIYSSAGAPGWSSSSST